MHSIQTPRYIQWHHLKWWGNQFYIFRLEEQSLHILLSCYNFKSQTKGVHSQSINLSSGGFISLKKEEGKWKYFTRKYLFQSINEKVFRSKNHEEQRLNSGWGNNIDHQYSTLYTYIFTFNMFIKSIISFHLKIQ